MSKMSQELERRLDENKYTLWEELKDADETICELCKRLNPQHAALGDYKGCNSCQDREPRLELLNRIAISEENADKERS